MPEPTKKPTIYRYQDAEGVEHLTTDKSSIPKEYVGKAKAYEAKHEGKAGDTQAGIQIPKDTLEQAQKMKDKGVAGAKKLSAGALKKTKALQHQAKKYVPLVADIHLESALFGFGTACGLMLIFKALRSSMKLVIKVAAALLIVGLIGAGYLGVMRTASGVGDSRLVTPKQILDDAKKARDIANQRSRKQKKMLDKIEEQSE